MLHLIYDRGRDLLTVNTCRCKWMLRAAYVRQMPRPCIHRVSCHAFWSLPLICIGLAAWFPKWQHTIVVSDIFGSNRIPSKGIGPAITGFSPISRISNLSCGKKILSRTWYFVLGFPESRNCQDRGFLRDELPCDLLLQIFPRNDTRLYMLFVMLTHFL